MGANIGSSGETMQCGWQQRRAGRRAGGVNDGIGGPENNVAVELRFQLEITVDDTLFFRDDVTGVGIPTAQ